MKWQNNFHGASAGRIWRCSREFAKKSGFLGLSLGFITLLASVGSAPAVFAEGLTLTVPQALSFDVTPNLTESAGTFGKSQASSLSAQTTTAFGYTLSLKLKNDDNSNKLMNGDHFLTSIEAAMTEDQFKSTAAANTWGFLPSKFNKIDNASYQPGPTVETMLDETDAPDSGTTPYSIGLAAKVNSEAATGSYNNTFVITLTANAVNYTVKYDLNGDGASGGPAAPLTGSSVEKTASVKIGSEVPIRDGYEFKGWCTDQTSDENCSGTTIEAGGDLTLNDLKKGNDNTVTLYAMWGYKNAPTTMQDFGDYCSQMGIHQTLTLRDTRDDNNYTVAKLKDGKCWMTQNLRIGSNSQQTILNSVTSDVVNTFTLPAGTTKKGSETDKSGWHWAQFDTSHIYIHNNNNYGGYYTWYAATAGEGSGSKSSGNTAHSICPKGWTLPTEGQFSAMMEQYDAIASKNNPPNFGSTALAGWCTDQGCPINANSRALWWSSTPNSGVSYVQSLRADSSDLAMSTCSKGSGAPIRCIAR